MPVADDAFENLRVELRRGSLTIALLVALREERYGYTLRRSTKARCIHCCAACRRRAC